jgi:hypothetical protein
LIGHLHLLKVKYKVEPESIWILVAWQARFFAVWKSVQRPDTDAVTKVWRDTLSCSKDSKSRKHDRI